MLRLDAVFRSAIDGIIVIDAGGRMEMVNQAAADLFGYDPEEMIGRNVRILMPEPHHQQHDGYLERYRRTGERHIIGIGREVEGRRKDGSLFPFRLSISEAHLADRVIFTGIIHDLTQQKKAERDLLEEKEKTRTYFDMANTLNVVLDAEGNILEANKKAAAFLRLPESDLQGKNWLDLILPEETKAQQTSFYRRMMKGEIPFENYLETRSTDGQQQEHVIAWHNTALTDEHGAISRMITSGIDITEQHRAEAHIKKLNAELEERVDQRTEELASAVNQLLNINQQLEYEVRERRAAEEALRKNEAELRKAFEKEKELSALKSRFVSMASHEFRTPLSTILSSADLVEAYTREDQQEKRLKHITRIKTAVANLTNILNDFLSLSRLEEGKIEHQPVRFELHTFFEEILDEVQGLLKRGQRIQHQLPMPQVEVVLDKKFLKNILLNLLSNAIKYSGEKQSIRCDVSLKDGYLQIAIEDRGIGIPEEEQQYLFTRFFRAHNVENIQGTGLGLNIVKRYVELMEGDIRFESVPERGTTFWVNIPLQYHSGQRPSQNS